MMMPTYDYRCLKCKHEFETVQKITDAPRKTCPLCKGKVKRMIGGGAGVIFKGSGFYVNDSRSASSGSKSGNGSKKDESSSSGESKETASSAKKETAPTTAGASKKSDS